MNNFLLYNTFTRQKAPVKLDKKGHLSLYVCGVTVYDHCHVGHARVMVHFDALIRMLESILEIQTRYVRNITDIDDKIIKCAQAKRINFLDLTQQMTAQMHEDYQALRLRPPTYEPKVTDNIAEIIAMIERLIALDYAYVTSKGNVYFRVGRYDSYGALSGKDLAALRIGVRIENESDKEAPHDFALWKACSLNVDAAWDSPFSKGRPGWHIECSAMAKRYLGDGFDVHGGGSDLIFPHHDNERAQSECANGVIYANHWMHVAPLMVEGVKMSKSIGNVVSIRDAVANEGSDFLRYFLLSSHYRSEMDYAISHLAQAKTAFNRLCILADIAHEAVPMTQIDLQKNPYGQAFVESLLDDMNTPKAFSVLFEILKEANKSQDSAKKTFYANMLRACGKILGIEWKASKVKSLLSNLEIEKLLKKRTQARADRDFALADKIRDDLIQMNIMIEDLTEGTHWYRRA